MRLDSRIGFVSASLALTPLSSLAAHPQAPPSSPRPGQARAGVVATKATPKIKVADTTPEDALRSFMLALLAQDEAAVRAVTLPNAEMDWLLSGQPAPPDVIKDATAQFEKRPMKRLKEGERVALPRGKQYVVKAGEVGEDRAVVLPEGAPVPTRLQKVTGHWKVAADPFIASRKAADAAKKRAAAKDAVPRKPATQN